MNRLGRWVIGLAGWRRHLAAVVMGALAAAALPPLHLLPLLVVAFTGLAWLVMGAGGWRGAFATGWWFGFGYFLVGLHWVGFAFLVEAQKFAWMMPMAVLALSAGLALFTGLAALIAHRLGPSGFTGVLTLAAAWTLAEWLRGTILTGLPWNLVGYAWTASEAMVQLAALTGIYGLSLVTVLAAATPAVLIGPQGGAVRRWLPVAGAIALLALIWAAGAARLATGTLAYVPDLRLRLVQANIPQHLKWRRDRREANFARHLQLSSSPGAAGITHLIWPETAVPYFLADEPERLRLIGGLLPPGGLLLTGAARRTPRSVKPFRVWNSVHAIDERGVVIATYDKFHLVPFGEYVPLRGLFETLGISKLVHGPTDFVPGPGPATLDLPGLPPFSPLICYEVIFPGAVTEPGGRPRWLLNLTNDAWFGPTSGPYQHLAMAAVRAVEQGLPLVRAAGTGISAIIDPYGRTVARLGLNRSGVLDSALPVAVEPPPYARLGDSPVLVLCLVLLVASGLARRRSRFGDLP